MEGLDSVYEEAHKLYEDGKRKEAFDRYLALAEEGFVDCQTFVGWMLFSGEGVKSDLIEARSWLERSSEKGDVEALYYLGKINIIEEKFESALACFKESMAHSYLPAVYALGMMYKLGQGVERSPEKAYECFDKAGNKGHIFSQKEKALLLIGGYYGIFSRLKGAWLFIRVLLTAFKLGGGDPHKESIRF